MARRVVGDDATRQSIIRIVPKQGVLFVPEHEFINPAQSIPNDRTWQGEKPSIVVLPFRNRHNDSSRDFFATGIIEDVITALTRFEEIVVLAHQTASAYSVHESTPSDFSKELKVDYYLECGIQRADNRVRISVRLVEVSSQVVVWSDRFDRDAVDVFAIQDEVSATVANALVGEVSNRRIVLAAAQAPREMKAYDHVLRVQKHIWTVSKSDLMIARTEADAAIELEPDYARTHAALSCAHLTMDQNGWGERGDG